MAYKIRRMTTSDIPQKKKVSIKPYVSNETVARLAITGLALCMFLSMVAMIFIGLEIGLVSKMMNDEFVTLESLEASDFRQQIIAITYVLAFLVTVIFFSIWFYRAYRNLPALGARGLHTSPGWAVGYFYIPIVNLYRPYRAAKEIWQASVPTSEPNHPNAWQDQKVSSIVGWWWGFWIASSVLGRISNRISSNVESLSGYRSTLWIDLGIQVIIIIAAILAIVVIKNVTAMQEEKYKLIRSWTI